MFGFPKDFKLLFKTVAGSHLYGTAMETSDTDERGVFLPSAKYFLGFHSNIEQFESKEPDVVLYELRKFLRLTVDCNPNMVELLFVPRDKWLVTSPEWETLLEHRDLFLSKKARYTFAGYAVAQLKRLRNHVMNVEVNREKRNAARLALEDVYGYDTKHAAHLLRLVQEGKELLLTGNLTFPRPNAAELLAVRNGALTLNELLDEVGDVDDQFDMWYNMSKLPDKPDREKLDQLCVDLVLRTLRG